MTIEQAARNYIMALSAYEKSLADRREFMRLNPCLRPCGEFRESPCYMSVGVREGGDLVCLNCTMAEAIRQDVCIPNARKKGAAHGVLRKVVGRPQCTESN